ncbi:LysR family transcriptional regulator [Cohaesibacter gelatinilyticus]|uniref:Transcriptional regulator, LysR family n=1 Tax=Cohaesibacter gelatinilyticus TaxID=372072 RepID=A0A285PJT1_9HYPH|nr:LysR family transcriptional regulator [Cohaesibacter gelatinilyticus]SNZ20376.1 transcriptional regulator, LysR family [Cohaesibacter gelatinilyticus]
MLPTIRQLEFFVATAEAGQISRAAALINVTQSSITIAIRRLESLLGYRLFNRKSHGMELTPQGEDFLRHANAILASLHEAIEAPKEIASDISGTVRLAVTDTISGYFLPVVWQRVAHDHPGLRLSVTEASRPQIEEGLFAGTYDLGLALTSNLPNPERYQLRQVLSSPRNLWVAANHSLADRETVSFAELNNENYILLTMDEHENTMRQIWEKYDFVPRILYKSKSMEALRSMVAQGMGVSILSDMVYRSWSLDGQRIVRKHLSDTVPNMDTGVFWPKENSTTTVTRALIKCICRGK